MRPCPRRTASTSAPYESPLRRRSHGRPLKITRGQRRPKLRQFAAATLTEGHHHGGWHLASSVCCKADGGDGRHAIRTRRRQRTRPWCCCTASATPATCGSRSPKLLVKDHTVIVPDLRGMGLSSHPEGGYEKAARRATSLRSWMQLEIAALRAGHPRHRQHGRLCAGRPVSGARHELGRDGCAASGTRHTGTSS